MKKLFERYPFFLVLLPAFVTVHLERELYAVINYRFVFDRVIIFFAFPIVLFFLFYLVNRSVKKSAYSTFIISVLFFYTGDVKNWLSYKFPASVWQSYSFLLPILLIASVILLFVIQRSGSNFRKHFLVFNIGLIFFIIADLPILIFNSTHAKYKLADETEINASPCSDCEKPDIYYIVPDTYASSEILKAKFKYPNNLFEDDLKNKGFYIVEASRSNYSYTAFSLGSTLNMSYIKNADTSNIISDREYLQSLKLAKNNRVFAFFENEGYRIFNHSLFEINSSPSSVSVYDNWGFRELFDQYNIFLKLKMDIGYHLPVWVRKLMGENKYYINDPVNRKKFDSTVYSHLKESVSSESNKPKFVYAHFLGPHPPYAYDSIGNLFDVSVTSDEEAYIHQVAYCNRIIKEITDQILETAKKPVIIILQGDHGTPFTNKKEPFNKLKNLNAIYFSNKDYRYLSDSMTNVNTFRILLNTFFQKKLPLLPNEFYVFKN